MADPAAAPEPPLNPLSPDPATVRDFILRMIKKGAFALLVTAVLELVSRMRAVNDELTRRLEAKSRKRPPNERFRRLQLELFEKNDQAAKKGSDGQGPEPKPKRKRGPKNPDRHGRPKLPEHLERIAVPISVPDALRICPTCHVEATRIGQKTAEKLDFEPARFVVRQEQREVLACQCCHEYVVTAPKPDEVVDRGILGEELLVHAAVDHYQDAVPWERMERRAQQQGVPLRANTLASSCGKMIDLFDPIVQYIFRKCIVSSYFALDATTMPVIDGEHPLGIRTGALWLLQGDHHYSYFMYAPTGHASHLEAKLEGAKLASVMSDGSPTNNVVERAGGARGGCNAHARRGLVAALRGGDERALRGLELFAAIFHVDAESKRAGETLAQRFERRQKDSAPLVGELRAWVTERQRDVEPKSKLGKSLKYIHRQWRRITRFLIDPKMELTNNEVERDLRCWVLDRKTWLFCGHEPSARRAADALTLITTCKKFGIDPRGYLRDTLRRILQGEKDLAKLLPENYKPDRPQTQYLDSNPVASEAA